MKKFLPFLFLPVFALPATPAHALPKIGPEIEVVMPFSSEARERFGSTITGIGLGFGSVVPKAGGHLHPDIIVAREEKNDNKLAFYGGGVQYRRTFQNEISEDAKFVPYYGAGVGLAYGKVELAGTNVDDSKIVPAGSLFLGSSIGKSGLFEARVRGLGKVGGLDFSGISFTLGARF